MTEAAILVFAKAPLPGQAKTRLIPALGAAGAATLHARLVRHTLLQAKAANVGPIILWCAPDVGHPFFEVCAGEFAMERHVQQGADLGQRMEYAMAAALRTYRKVLLIGTDCPDLTPAILQEAAQTLDHACGVVLVPAHDGGYALIGALQHAPPVFDDVAWGSNAVLACTRRHLRAGEIGWMELPSLPDIDVPDDLAHLTTTHPYLLDGIPLSGDK
jgi:rSAM/selenodomain-associated transferase 1